TGGERHDCRRACLDHLVGETELVEIGADQHAVHRIILDNEQMPWQAASRLRLLGLLTAFSPLGGNRKPEHTALADFALATDLAAHYKHQTLRDRTPETGETA